MNKFVLDKDNSLVMVVDIQERLVPAMKTKVSDKVIKNANILLSAAHEFNMPIITTEQYPKGLGPTVNQLVNNIDPSLVFEKTSFTAYTHDVKEAISKQDKKQIIITGMETHICVFQTVRDLLQDGYQVFVLEDGVCSRSKYNFRNGISMLREMGAVVTNIETVLFDLLKEAGTPEFKVLSKLIK